MINPNQPNIDTTEYQNLDKSINSVQALANQVDKHTHNLRQPQAADDFLIGAQVGGTWTWARKTLAQAVAILRTSLDNAYAALTHDHAGAYEPADVNIQAHIAAAAPHSGHSLANHNHDGTYSPTGHAHAGVYEPANANIQGHISAAAPHTGHALAGHTHATPADHISTGSLSDGEVFSFAPAAATGLIIAHHAGLQANANEFITAFFNTSTPVLNVYGGQLGAQTETATGILSGATGTAGKFTVSVHTNGRLYFENRRGVARTWRITVFT